MIKVAIVDDDELVRRSLKMLINLEEDIKVVAQGKNGYDAIEIMENKDIDCMLLDMRMPQKDGIQALEEIKDKHKVLILSTFDEERYIIPAIKMGAKGYILKNSQPQEIMDAIRNVYRGINVYGNEAMDIIRDNLAEKSKLSNIFDDLSDREKEVCQLISQGMNNQEIADSMYLSVGTIKNYISSILDKTGLDHRTQIAINWLKNK